MTRVADIGVLIDRAGSQPASGMIAETRFAVHSRSLWVNHKCLMRSRSGFVQTALYQACKTRRSRAFLNAT